MNSKNKLETVWTWEEWQASRPARRAAAKRVGASIVRRSESSSDRRLHAAFAGQRGPSFHGEQSAARQALHEMQAEDRRQAKDDNFRQGPAAGWRRT